MSIASSTVTLLIRAQSAGTAGLAAVRTQLSSFATDTAAASSAWVTFKKGVIEGLGHKAVDFGLQKVDQGIAFLKGKFQEATQLQLDNTVAVSTLESLANISFEDANKTLTDMNSALAKAAASLPGSTQDYKNLATAISGSLIPAFKDARTGAFQINPYKERVSGLAETYGAIAAASKTSDSVMNGLQQAIQGGSLGTLKDISFFMKNRNLLEQVKKKLRELGKTELSDLTKEQRTKVLLEAGKAVATDSFKKRSAKTVDGLIQSFISSLFDPDTGIFGIMRNLAPGKTKAESVFSALNVSLDLLVGENGAFNQLGRLLEAAGIKLVDPMKLLYGGIQIFNEAVSIVILSVEAATETFKKGGSVPEAIAAFFGTAKSYLVKDFANVSFGFLANSTLVLGAGGTALSFAILNSGVLKLVKDLGRLGVFAGNEVLAGISTLGMGVVRLSAHIGTAAKSTYLLSAGLIRAAPSAAVAAYTSVQTAIVGMVAAMRGFSVTALVAGAKTLLVAGWAAIPGLLSAAGAGIWGFVTSIGSAGIALMANPLVIGIVAIAAMAALIYKYWEPIGAFFQGFTAGLIEGFAPIGPLFNAVGSVFNALGSMISPLIGWFAKLLTPVHDTDNSARNLGKSLGEGVGGAIKFVVSMFEGFFNILAKVIGKIKDGVTYIGSIPAFASLFPSTDNTPQRAASGIATITDQSQAAFQSPVIEAPRFRGQVPHAAMGLMEAATQELREKPSGARLVVANSQEFILQDRGAIAPPPVVVPIISISPPPSSVVAPVASVPLPPPSRSGGNTFIFQIQGGNNTAQAIADEVLSRIQSLVEGELEGQLVP